MRVAVGINRNLTVIAEIETLSHLSWEKPLRGWLKEMVEGKKVNLAQLWGLVRRALQEPTPHRV
jgi:hypothetical protein